MARVARWVLAAAIAASAGSTAPAAEVRVNGITAHVSGFLSAEDIEVLEKSEIREILFEGSPGGNLKAAKAYVNFIRERGLNTRFKRECYSACAISFLAGKSRSVDNSVLSSISFHVGRKKVGDKWEKGDAAVAVMTMIDELTGGKMKDPARGKIESSWQETSGVLFLMGPGVFWGKISFTFYCNGSEGGDLTKCALLPDSDPYDMGVLTKK